MALNLTYISQEKCIINHIIGISLFPHRTFCPSSVKGKPKFIIVLQQAQKSDFINLKYIKVSLIKNTKLAYSFEKMDNAASLESP